MQWEYCAVIQLAFGTPSVQTASSQSGSEISFQAETGVYTDEQALTTVQFYERDEIIKKERLSQTIAELGRYGWEMCGHSRVQAESQSIAYWYFKRPKDA